MTPQPIEALGAAFTAFAGKTDEALTDIRSQARLALETAERVQAIMQRPRAGGASGFEGGFEGANGKAEFKALGTLVRTGDETELKAMSVGSDPDGGYLVHPVISDRMTKKLFDQSPMRRLARVETITTGDSWEEPVDNDDVGAEWVGEAESRPATDTAQLGMLKVPVREIYALQPVTQRLIDDASIDVGGWVEGKVSDKFARTEGLGFVSGSTPAQPSGFLSGPTPVSTTDATRPWGTLQYVPSGAATSVTADGLRDLAWGVRAPYRPGATWLMNSATANAIDKLKDGNGDYLWRDGMTAGAPPSLLGHPVAFDENLADVGAGAFPIAFGDWKRAYLIVDKAGIRWLRDPFTSKPNVLIYAYRRVGGGLANSEAVKLLKIATS